jgi:hypothetical protein
MACLQLTFKLTRVKPIENISRPGGVAEMVERLCSRCEALSSNSSTSPKYFYAYIEK